ncbi:MAG: hypothetical protein IJW97_05770, partial [Clostridia bacterium]|nr:hypothetical protein [Clostridia bacterium]
MSYVYGVHPQEDARIGALLTAIDTLNRTRFDGALSVLLLGSLSKGEGTLLQTKDGARLLSDIELLVVTPDGFDQRAAFTAALHETTAATLGTLVPKGCCPDHSFVARRALPRLEKKLLIYDAARYGVPVSGEDVRALLPRVTVHNINRRDVRDIVAHRLYAVLQSRALPAAPDTPDRYRYALAKNTLDLYTVLLFSRGIPETTVEGRQRALHALGADAQELQLADACVAIKLGTTAPPVDTATVEGRQRALHALGADAQELQLADACVAIKLGTTAPPVDTA